MSKKGRHIGRKRLPGIKQVVVVGVITLMIALCVFVAIFQIIKEKPAIQEKPETQTKNLPEVKDTTSDFENGFAVESSPVSTPETSEEEITELTREPDTFTFLVAANDQSSGNADTILVIKYDTAHKKVGMVSIPRDTLINPAETPAHFPKINSTYHYGIEALKTAVSDLLGIPIDFYLTIKTDGFIELVDTIGGVDFDIPVHMSYDDPLQKLSIHFEPGWQHLDGASALGVCRLRSNQDGTIAYPDYDIGRTKTQQAMLKTIAKKILTQPQKFEDYIRIFLEYCETDLSFGNILWLAESAIGFDMERDLETATLAGDGETTCQDVKYCYELYPSETLDIVNSIINPYVLDRTIHDLNVFTVKSSKK